MTLSCLSFLIIRYSDLFYHLNTFSFFWIDSFANFPAAKHSFSLKSYLVCDILKSDIQLQNNMIEAAASGGE